ncbi:MAG: HlyC/CorC family transporter [Ignavibacteriaceae bacterium]|nr:HlyC/CorC family transporter [Ignavibacteriaceae bacterium]
MGQDIVLLIVLILMSGFFSGTEMAYLISNRIKVELRTGNRSFASRSSKYFFDHPEVFFSTVLIGNNIVNISFASVSAVVLVAAFGLSEWQVLVVSSVLLLLFGELIPKYLAGEIPHTLYLLFSAPLKVISIAFSPLVAFTSTVSRKVIGKTDTSSQNVMGREDILLLVRESLGQQNQDDQQSRIIKRIFDLKETRVYEVMRPRTEIAGVELDTHLDIVLKMFAETGYSKLPVFEDTLDDIKGIVYAFDLFTNPDSLSDVIREVPFVPETKSCIELLNEMMAEKYSIAIVIDEFGGTAGLVTLEDVLEEMFGEIRDEYDTEDSVLKKIKEDSYLMSGNVELDHITDKFGITFTQGDYTTLSGYITSTTGRIPEQGEILRIGQYQFSIVKANKVRIEFIRLRIMED